MLSHTAINFTDITQISSSVPNNKKKHDIYQNNTTLHMTTIYACQ